MIASSVQQLIDTHGVAGTFTVTGAVSRSDTTLVRSNTVTTHTARVFVRNFTEREINSLVIAGDRRGYLAAKSLPFTPKTNDRLLADGQNYNIMSVDKRTANGSAAVFILHLRGVNFDG